MDNIRIREDKNRLIIKKGWIAKKFIILYFSYRLFCFMESSFPAFLVKCFINIDYIIFKNKLYYEIYSELFFLK